MIRHNDYGVADECCHCLALTGHLQMTSFILQKQGYLLTLLYFVD